MIRRIWVVIMVGMVGLVVVAGVQAMIYVTGDVNIDGIVSYTDNQLLVGAFTLPNSLVTYPQADINKDGVLDSYDYNAWINAYNNRPVMPITGITKLHFQQWSDIPTEVTYLSDAYKAFVGSSNALEGYNLAWKSQEIKAMYFETTTPPMPFIGDAQYPIHYPDAQDDEANFIHASDPAGLHFYRGNGSPDRYVVYWQGDDRIGNFNDGTYELYRCDGCGAMYPQVWDPQWKTQPWQKVGTYQAKNFANGMWLSMEDTNITDLNRNGTKGTCYMVKAGTGGIADKYYSLPMCNRYDQMPPNLTHLIQGLTITKTGQQNPPSPKVNDWYANVTYTFDLRISNPDQVSKVEVVQYGFTTNPLVVGGKTTEQMQKDFGEIGRYNLPVTATGAQGYYILRRPIMANPRIRDGSLYVESPVFRIVTYDKANISQNYPMPGAWDGYLTVHPNQRIENRWWSGLAFNPGSTGWQNASIGVFRNWQTQGYNAVFFDNWAAKHFAPDNNTFEVKSVEFGNYWADYAGVDPTTQALDRYGNAMRTALPTMTFIGNGLWLGNGDVGIRAMQSIHGGMYETCMHHGGFGIYKGQQLVDLMAFMDKFVSGGKKLICLASYEAFAPNTNPFEPTERLYAIAGYLLTAQNKTNGNTYYGQPEYFLSWGNNVNMPPELFVDIGEPAKTREEIGTYAYKREFTKGMVYVNGGSGSVTVTVPTTLGNLRRVDIANVSVTRNSNGGITAANPGTINYTPVTGGSNLTIPGESAVILAQ